MGDFNEVAAKSLKWRYERNIDDKVNSHGTKLAVVCQEQKVLPLNHCRYYNKTWDGKFTYYKAGKQSQIDLCLTTQQGRQCIVNFKIPENNWHLSDHLPIDVSLSLSRIIDAHMLLLRTKELSDDYRSASRVKQFKYDINIDSASQQLHEKLPFILSNVASQPAETSLKQLQDQLHPILRINRNTQKRQDQRKNTIDFDLCNKLYEKLQSARRNQDNDDEINKIYDEYQTSRRKLNKDVCTQHETRFSSLLSVGDDQKLWKEINWSGKYKKREESDIHVDTMADYFENLYEPLDKNECKEFDDLHTNIYIPVTDDPITNTEIKAAAAKTKKGGYDYSLSVLQLFTGILLPFFTLFFNVCFFVSYPVDLALSILCAIPKKGNLRLPTNYRGIQLQPLIASVYDRILHNRLLQWAKFSPEQSAFQKGRSTIDQVFLLRTIIALAKHSKTSLFIGFFDLSKAFDKVSRTLLLKSLIKLGIGASCSMRSNQFIQSPNVF